MSTAISFVDDVGVVGANATLRMGVGVDTVVPLIGGGTTWKKHHKQIDVRQGELLIGDMER